MAEGGPPGPAHREGQKPPPQQPQPGQQVQMHMNWLHFKPEFSGKPEKMLKCICYKLMIG